MREVPINEIVESDLLEIIFKALDNDNSFEAAVDCLCKVFKETNEVDEYLSTIQVLLPKLLALQPRIVAAAESEDMDVYKGVTRLFAEAGEAWVVLIARQPAHFRPLVEAVLECAARDQDREAISLTFIFWYELKLYLVIERYMEARVQFVDVYSKLVDIIMKHLEYPTPDDPTATDLFDGDRELEEKFRSFRHEMGDVLKDSCEIMGVTQCLTKVLERLQHWMSTYGGQATSPTSVPHWQQLEAPLFSMRAMGRMVDKEENLILPQIIPLIVQIPAHEKLRFAAIMVLGRYTEWTSNHPEFLEAQFNYVTSSFEIESKEIIRAAAMSMKFFCSDCKHLLGPQVVNLQQFYDKILDSLPQISQEEMTEGVATVVAVQPPTETYKLLKLFCDPLMARLKALTVAANDKDGKLAVAGMWTSSRASSNTDQMLDHLQLITFFVQWVAPHVEAGAEHPGVQYCQEIFPVLEQILERFIDFPPICERICRCWRYMFISYRTHMTPLLPAMANRLALSFAASNFGCFLWVTSAIMREFSEDREVDDATTDGIYAFFEQQATTTLRAMSNLGAVELPDVIEDFFRLLTDAIIYYPYRLIPSALFGPIFEAAISSALTLEQREPLIPTLHYLRDVIAFGTDNPPMTNGQANPPEIKERVTQVLASAGVHLVNRVMAGMMMFWPRDCYADGSGVLLGLLELMPEQTAQWIGNTLSLLPAGTVTAEESQRLMTKIGIKLSEGPEGARSIRGLLQDFTNNYRRRNVAPRDGLGGLEATRFRFSG